MIFADTLVWMFFLDVCFRLGNRDLDFKRHPNPDFMDFLFTVRLGNPKKDLQNYSLEQWSSSCELYVHVQDRCS